VAQDQIIVRFNFQPSFSTRQQRSFQFPESIGYGYTAKLGLFVNLNQGFVSADSATPSGTMRPLNGGFGDIGFYARYTLYKVDKPNSTFRVTPLAGAFLPTGSNSFLFQGKLQGKSLQTGSGTVDPYVGVAAGLNAQLLRESAIFQISSLRWQVGAGIQLPLMQDLNGTGRATQKLGYLLFFEYYLAAPIWRKHG
jgi:hypothetical protein